MKKTLERNDNKEFTFSAFEYAAKWTPAEEKFHSEMRAMGELAMLSMNMPSVEAAHGEVELAMVGAIGTNFNKTQDLHVMNYREAMEDPRVEDVKAGVKTEHDKFLKYGVWKAIDETEALPGERIIDTTSAIKPKPTGEMRVRVVARGFKQEEGIQYKKDDKAAPVINLITIRIAMVLMCMCNWYAYMLDVEGAFFNERFLNGERILLKVLEPFRKWYPSYVLLVNIAMADKNNVRNTTGSH